MTTDEMKKELRELQEKIKLFELILECRKKLEELGIKLEGRKDAVPYPAPYPIPYPVPYPDPYNPFTNPYCPVSPIWINPYTTTGTWSTTTNFTETGGSK